LCNPDDHRLCGPLPRPTSANAMICTGVAQMRMCLTSNSGGKAAVTTVLFRIYVEDRGEPGGGNKPLPDVYSFQAWALSSSAAYTDSQIIAARQALANDSCAFIQHYTTGALPDPGALNPNVYDKLSLVINDSGGLHSGNHQIHPTTEATCP